MRVVAVICVVYISLLLFVARQCDEDGVTCVSAQAALEEFFSSSSTFIGARAISEAPTTTYF